MNKDYVHCLIDNSRNNFFFNCILRDCVDFYVSKGTLKSFKTLKGIFLVKNCAHNIFVTFPTLQLYDKKL